MESNSLRIGVDLGGTKTSICVIDVDGSELVRQRAETPQTDQPRDIVATIADLVSEVEKNYGAGLPVGIGTPGSLSPKSGLLRNSNTVCLNGFPFKAEMEAVLGRSVKIENDANCLALAEAELGAGRGHDVVFAAIVGTGVGGGLVAHGRLLSGRNGLGGEWGHNPMPWSIGGNDCYCGRAGCVETFLSGKGAAKRYEQAYGEPLKLEEVVGQWEAGASAAEAFMDEYQTLMAQAFASIINVYDPSVIVLGGGVSRVKRIYPEVVDRWQKYVFSNEVVTTPLVSAALGDDAGVIGAALLNEVVA